MSAVGTPELEHLVGLLEVTEWRPAGGVIGSHDPTDGKSGGTTPRSMQAERERRVSDMSDRERRVSFQCWPSPSEALKL